MNEVLVASTEVARIVRLGILGADLVIVLAWTRQR
jgi:hypothetical protein